ncbi:E3 SUMO protein ligase [Trema orientale]|uniref:E3 SUMO protein ligase n=1 Tax=Trema orientale TaxID=63057 RepID=A0A2P5FJ10_TREOI|nr:E3 SUMO protein ligase [Trema orientale]
MTETAAGRFSSIQLGVKQRLSPAVVNSFRISSVMDKLASILRPGLGVDPVEFFNLCLSLARGIDYAVANNEQPAKTQDIPSLVKQICERKSDHSLQPVIMVVMISVKNACKAGWFSEKETEELCILANEIGRNFCSPVDINTVTSCFDSTIATVMERFYPQLKMGHILASLDVKSGYGVYAVDFHIWKKTTHSQEEKIRLFVAQVDNVETSACIISPQQVNFLINGKGVDRRINVFMDTGPQMPTNVTTMLKYGTNLLQAVGQFNGHYVIVVAFMSEMPLSEIPVLPDYVQPLVDGFNSDLDLIEGPSRISLNCPISYTRIKTPVKGHSCKHLQCFDFSNFIDINSRRPSWRCPHCNQCVCFSNIRVDQNMLKVLKEVGKDVADVIISTDGSWKAVLENDDHLGQAHDTNLNCLEETSKLPESTTIPNTVPSVVDLTGDDTEMDTGSACDIEDRKPSKADLSAPAGLSDISRVNQNVGGQVEDEFWPGLYVSSGLATTAWSDPQMFGGVPQSTPATFVQAPVLPNVVPPVLNHENDGGVSANLTTSEMQSYLSSQNNLQLQQMQFMNSIASNEYGRFPTIPQTVSRTPIAVQALPAQSQAPPAPPQRLRSNLNSSTASSSAVASQGSLSPTVGFNTVYSDVERRQHFSRSLINQPQASNVASSSSQPRLATQNQNRQDHSLASQLPNAYRSSSALMELQNAHLQQALNPRMPQPMGQSSNAIRSSHLPRIPVLQQGVAQLATAQASSVAGNQQQTRIAMAAQRVAQVARQSPLVQNQTSRHGPSLPVNAVRVSTGDQRGTVGGVVQADSRADGLVDSTSERNWRPTGRMRGSLSGRAYSSALNQLMTQPTQSPQPARPPLVPAYSLPMVKPQLPVLIANNRNAHTSQPHNHTK